MVRVRSPLLWTDRARQGSMMRVLFSWQAQYFVMLEGDSCCSAHRTGRFMAGAILRGVGGCTDCYFVARSTTE